MPLSQVMSFFLERELVLVLFDFSEHLASLQHRENQKGGRPVRVSVESTFSVHLCLKYIHALTGIVQR